MSEAAPGIPDSDAFATPERAALASAIRVLIDTAMTVDDVSSDVLLSVAADVSELTARLGPRRDPGAGYQPRQHDDYLPRSPVVGEASPISPRLSWETYTRSDGTPAVEARGTFGAVYEGPPSFVHGGWVACTFDEVLGIANIVAGNPGMTARLIVHYRKPTPLFRPLVVRAWVDRVEGRRIMSRAELYDGETLTAEAEGLFVQPRPEVAQEYFGRQFPENSPEG